MHYSSIAYFQGVMTGKGVKREVGVWFWQETRPDPLYLGVGWEECNETQRITNIHTRLKAKSMCYLL
ncbi:hypothetical protein [Pseudoalteromonas sp. Z9A5]|uniref:hypothetical protein n=1 Tax=Pseudoalteromonas sp. Z9A5 TaxID=2686355 RepID=UPI00140B5CB8|nr:hypothetical protein [Pseudoalteromonas sp. Z9A5]